MSISIPALFILLLTGNTVLGQINVKSYRDMESYVAKTATNESVELTAYPVISEFEDYLYKVSNADKNSKTSFKNSLFVEYNEYFLINCSIIMQKRYAPVYYKNKHYMYFRAPQSKLKEHELQMHIAGNKKIKRAKRSAFGAASVSGGVGFLAGGLIGGTIAGAIETAGAEYDECFNYLVHIPSGEVKVIDIPYMQQLLERKPKLAKQYMKEEHPEDATSIAGYLKAVFED